MIDISQYLFIKDLSQYKQQFNTHRGFEICDYVLLGNDLSYYVFSKNANG